MTILIVEIYRFLFLVFKRDNVQTRQLVKVMNQVEMKLLFKVHFLIIPMMNLV